MRRFLAGLLAIATGVVIVLLSAWFAWERNRPVPPPDEPAAETRAGTPQAAGERAARGRLIYDAERCSACHTIAGAGSPRVPLDGVGSRLSRADIARWIVAPQEMKRGVPKPAYTHLSAGDLEALVDYLAGLTAPSDPLPAAGRRPQHDDPVSSG